jgi:hypothetical protein
MSSRRIILISLLLLIAWIVIDLNYPYKTDIKNFNPAEVARLDGAMWRSYYEKKKLKLFFQAAELERRQFHVPFWRSCVMAYQAAKAAFVFKDGKDEADYKKALPDLIKYYQQINTISNEKFDAEKAAKLELEWWVVRRYRDAHPPAEWERYLSLGSETMYHIAAEKFSAYSHLRVEAMLLRDHKGDKINEDDWQKVNTLLQQAWKSFSDSLHS